MLNLSPVMQLFSQKHSYEDAHKLLESLLLISALLLAFAVGGLQNLDHDDMVNADARFLALMQDPAFLANNGISLDEQERFLAGRWLPRDLVSHACLIKFYNCVVVQISTLVIALALFVSLSFSSGMEDKMHFEAWMSCCKWIIAGDYVLLLVGIFFLFDSNHALVNMKFPLYNNNNLSTIFDNKTATMVEGGDWMHQREAWAYRTWTIVIVSIAVGIIFVIHVVLVVKSNVSTKLDNQTQTTTIIDSGGVSEMSVQSPTIAQTVIVSPRIVPTRTDVDSWQDEKDDIAVDPDEGFGVHASRLER